MVPFRWLDEPLQTELDSTAVAALRQWCTQTDISFRLVHWLIGGRSAALVAAVLADHPHDGTRQLIMKLDRVPGTMTNPQPGEFAQHRRALAESPDFARRHLTEPVYQPIPVGDGRWFVFQRVAGGSLRDPITLHTLLDTVLHPPRPVRGSAPGRPAGPQPVFPRSAADADTFAEVSAAIVRSVLAEWSGPMQLPSMDVPAILGRQLGDRLAPGSRLSRLAAAHTGRLITVEGEDHPLPNPFALVLDADRTAGVRLPTFVGRAHGDLHVENVLVPTTLGDASAAFQLIDLSRYASDAVLTRDPTHLVLHVLARTLVELSPAQRTATIDLLLDPDRDGALVPRWLWLFIDQVRSAGETWTRPAGLVGQWRDQLPLSLLACALTCLGRASTREEDQGWFLRLAANAAAAFLDQHRLDQHRLDQHDPAGPDREPQRPQQPDVDELVHTSSGPVATGSANGTAAVDGSAVDAVLSHARADAAWAGWIGWHLEAAGWRVLPYPDPGHPDEAIGPADQGEPGTAISLADVVAQTPWTLVVLSPAYLSEVLGSVGWREAFPTAGAARDRRLVTIRVAHCVSPGWLGRVVSVDLVGLGADEARATLVARMTALRDGSEN